MPQNRGFDFSRSVVTSSSWPQDDAKSLNNLLSGESLGPGLGNLKVTSNLVPIDSLTGIAKITSRLVVDCALPVHRGLYSCAAVSGTETDVSSPATVYVEGMWPDCTAYR